MYKNSTSNYLAAVLKGIVTAGKRPCYVACLHKVASSAYQASNLSQVDYCYKLAGNGSPLDLLWYEGE